MAKVNLEWSDALHRLTKELRRFVNKLLKHIFAKFKLCQRLGTGFENSVKKPFIYFRRVTRANHAFFSKHMPPVKLFSYGTKTA